MKILYTGLRAEYYDPKRAPSFEYVNFYLTLARMAGVTVIEHPFDRILEVGKKKFNDELWQIVAREKPDLLFAFMYTDELDPATLARITNETKTKTVAWFADDYWRFFNYSKHWAPRFTYAVTTYHKAIEWYRAAGITNVLLSQWACNTNEYKPAQVAAQDIPASFVGQYKPARAEAIAALRTAGVGVEAYGFGWPSGRVSKEDALRLAARSKINLNLNARAGFFSPSVIARIFLRRSINRLVSDFHLIENLQAYLHFPTLHTHARPFELAGMGAFVISGYSDGIERYYQEGKEMVFYRTTPELVEKARYYLAHDAEREAIRKAGYERTIREHTYEARFRELFARCGLLSQ